MTESQSAAKRATGPTSPEGKAKSSLNALKTGLTGRTVLLPSEDAILYKDHLQSFADDFQPVGRRETELVQSLADQAWRLMRIPALEMAIYASGHEQFAELFADRDPDLQPGLIDMHTFLHYEKQLRNLQIQEGRLRRYREKDMAELRRLQQERLAQAALNVTPGRQAPGLAFPSNPLPSRLPQLPVDAARPRQPGNDEFEFSFDAVDLQSMPLEDFDAARAAIIARIERASEVVKAA